MTKMTVMMEIKDRLGEPGYSFLQIASMLKEIGLEQDNWYRPGEIKNYAIRNDLAIPLEDLEISAGRATHTMPESGLQDLVDGLGIPTSLSALKDVAEVLGYRV